MEDPNIYDSTRNALSAGKQVIAIYVCRVLVCNLYTEPNRIAPAWLYAYISPMLQILYSEIVWSGSDLIQPRNRFWPNSPFASTRTKQPYYCICFILHTCKNFSYKPTYAKKNYFFLAFLSFYLLIVLAILFLLIFILIILFFPIYYIFPFHFLSFSSPSVLPS